MCKSEKEAKGENCVEKRSCTLLYFLSAKACECTPKEPWIYQNLVYILNTQAKFPSNPTLYDQKEIMPLVPIAKDRRGWT